MTGPTLHLHDVSLSLGGHRILENLTLDVAAGEIHCVVGSNGGGKTSLIRCILGQMPHTGSIEIEWADSRTIGYVPQALAFEKTLPITVADFMALAVHGRRPAFLGLGKKYRDGVVAALDAVGMADKLLRPLGGLSGGERQRVLFAQAMLPEPSLLVVDEPMAGLDEHGAEIMSELIQERAAAGTTVIWIAHELALVREVANSVSALNRELLFSGPLAEVADQLTPELLFSALAVHAEASA